MSGPRATAVTLALAFLAVGVAVRTTMSPDIVLLALVIGLSYLLLGAALALTYRMSLVVNLAIATIGVLGYTVAELALTAGLPWVVAVVIGVAAAGGAGALTELLLVRRLLGVPRVVAIMATCALAVGLNPVMNTLALNASRLPEDGSDRTLSNVPWVPSLRFGVYVLTASSFVLFALVVVLLVAVVITLRRTQVGLRALAAADDRSLAQLSAIPAGRYVLVAWAAAGAMATLITILGPFPVASPHGDIVHASTTLGINTDAATSVLRLVVWPAVIAAVGWGRDAFAMVVSALSLAVLEIGLLWNDIAPTWIAIVTAVILTAHGLITPPPTLREERPAAWLAVHLDARWPAPWRDLPAARRLRRGLTVLGFVVLAAILVTRTSDNAQDAATAWMALVVLGLAVFVETGMAGALTFAPLPIAAAGAMVAVVVTERTGAVGLGLIGAIAIGVPLGAIVAALDLRARGLTSFAATLAFSLGAATALKPISGADPGVPLVGGEVVSRRTVMLAVAALALVAFLLVRNLSRSAGGRAVIAVRDNRSAARAFGLGVGRLRLAVGVASGSLAGLGGALLVHSRTDVEPLYFSTYIAVALISACLVGGLSAPSGAVIGTFVVFGLPLMFTNVAGLLNTNFGVGLGALMIILVWPGGILAVWRTGRDAAVRRLAERYGFGRSDQAVNVETGAVDPYAVEVVGNPYAVEVGATDPDRVDQYATGTYAVVGTSAMTTGSDRGPGFPPHPSLPTFALEAHGLFKSFGGVVAVRDVHLVVQQGEIVTLVGPNGAGKTTVFDVMTGFLRQDAGQVLLNGVDISGLSPAERAGQGLIRTFQNAALFPTLTARETVSLALERDTRLPLLRGALHLDRAARRRAAQSEEILDRFGLSGYADTRVGHLSTGTRRILDLAAAHALEARVLLLDEPAAGVAQREVEALAGVIEAFRRDQGVAIVVIEHDLALCSRIGDRMVVMEAGAVIADGPADVVLGDDLVLEAYVGAGHAMQRSEFT